MRGMVIGIFLFVLIFGVIAAGIAWEIGKVVAVWKWIFG